MRPQALQFAIGDACREARKQLGLTQEDVAERVGVVPEVYGRLERGQMAPSVHTLRKLCVVLSVSSDHALALAKGGPSSRPAREQEGDSPALRRILRRARRLTPSSLRALSHFIGLLPVAGSSWPTTARARTRLPPKKGRSLAKERS